MPLVPPDATPPEEPHEDPADDPRDDAHASETVADAVERFIEAEQRGDAPDPERFAAEFPPELRRRVAEACRSYLSMRPVLDAAHATSPVEFERLAHYRILGELGSGSMARVYLAHDERDDRKVALKVLHAHLQESETLLERFRREAQVIRRVRDPHVVSVHQVGRAEGRWFIAMELVQGGSLAQELRRRGETHDRPWSPAEAMALARDVCRGLVAVHARGIVHRDIKPQNILLDENGRAKLADFGLAQLVDRRRLTLSGQLQGTPYYMSPEQALARRVDVDHRTDLYSLGVVLYELLTRQRPFEGETSHQVLYAISFKRPRSLRSLNPEVPPDLETICLKALEKSPDDRFVDAQDMLGDLERHRLEQPIVGRLPSPAKRFWRVLRAQRRVLGVTSAVVLLVLLGAWAWVEHEATRAGWARVSVLSTLDESGQEVWARRIDPATTLLGEPRRLGAVPLRGHRLEPGAWRLQLLTRRDALAETTLWLEPGDRPRTVELVPSAPSTPAADMLPVQGGIIDLVRSARTREDGSIELLLLEADVSVDPFLIDAALVTNGDYLAYLAEHPEAERPNHWPAPDAPEWNERSPRFDELPVVGISAVAAQAYARSRGARLPSLAEWQLAAQGPDALPFPWGREAGDLFGRANVAETLPEDLRAANWRYYNERVRPVRDAHPDNVSPAGLLQPLGNTWEFTESPMAWPADASGSSPQVLLYTKGPGWTALHATQLRTYGLLATQLSQYKLPDPLSGFRCVRSITPWREKP